MTCDRDGWEPWPWWRVIGPDGALWAETSDRGEARAAMRPGDRLQRLWRRTEYVWEDDRP